MGVAGAGTGAGVDAGTGAGGGALHSSGRSMEVLRGAEAAGALFAFSWFALLHVAQA